MEKVAMGFHTLNNASYMGFEALYINSLHRKWICTKKNSNNYALKNHQHEQVSFYY